MSGEKNAIRHPYIKTFFTGFLMFLLGMSPLLIMSKGVYLWMGDYNEQTIMFTQRISRLLHSGQGIPAFDWGSMLGMDFLTSYHDHLFSPFDWLLYAVPYAALPYVHSAVLAVKVGLAAVTAELYCRQYVKTDRSAYICGILYAFSGYQLFDLVYQFSDRYLMFPLLLYSFDQLVINKRPFCFSALLCLYCLISPVFAWMICLFLLIYYVVRTAVGSFPRLDLRLFVRLAIETGFGVLMGAVVLLPFYLVLSGNTRASNSIIGHSLLIYEKPGVLFGIIRSMIFPPALCGSDWYLGSGQISISPPLVYIPLFLVLGVYIVMKAEKREWYSVLLKVCAVIACVPVLNSAFAMFNNLYYGRWSFMPLLIMIMMTGRYIDDMESMKPKKELRVLAAAVGAVIVYGVYAVYCQKPAVMDNELWIILAAASALGMIVLYLLHFPRPELKLVSLKHVGALTCVFCFVPFFGTSFFVAQNSFFEYVPNEVSRIWNDFEPIELEGDEFFRTSNCMSDLLNISMMWDRPTVNTFNSMMTGDTCAFFEEAGDVCTQSLHLDKDDYAVCSFLSVKYDLFFNQPLMGGVAVEPEDLTVYLEGFDMSQAVNRYVVYKNRAFIPMGFTYDNYLVIPSAEEEEEESGMMGISDGDNIKELYKDKLSRQKLLLKAIWLTPEQVKKYGGILTELPEEKYNDVSVETYYRDCSERAANACYEFLPDSHGFNARIDLDKGNLVFFSVPYSKAFTACVDGTPAEIERVFNGLSAVYVPQGDHSISFRYEIPGFKAGCIVSGVSAGVIVIYTAADLILKRRLRRREKTAAAE